MSMQWLLLTDVYLAGTWALPSPDTPQPTAFASLLIAATSVSSIPSALLSISMMKLSTSSISTSFFVINPFSSTSKYLKKTGSSRSAASCGSFSASAMFIPSIRSYISSVITGSAASSVTSSAKAVSPVNIGEAASDRHRIPIRK